MKLFNCSGFENLSFFETFSQNQRCVCILDSFENPDSHLAARRPGARARLALWDSGWPTFFDPHENQMK